MKKSLLKIGGIACLLTCVVPARSLTVEDLFSGEFRPRSIVGITPSADGVHYTCLSPDRTCIVRYAYATGEAVDTLLDVNKVETSAIERIGGYSLSGDEKSLLVFTGAEMIYRRSFRAAYYFSPVKSDTLQAISDRFPKQQAALLSPDGSRVAFVHENNIYVKNLSDGTEREVTRDGEKNRILNGITDWVYEEEFAQTRLMVWSPDSRALGFVRTDESRVQEYPMQWFCSLSGRYEDPQEVYPRYAGFKYPVAGADNSLVSFRVWREEADSAETIALPVDAESYLPALTVIPSTGEWVVTALNRLQNRLRLLAVSPHDNTVRTLYEEQTDTYINENDLTSAIFCPDCFLVFSERTGYRHLYQYGYDGILQRAVTSGDWEVTDYYGRDEKGNVYYQSDEEGPLYRAVYCVDKRGKCRKLSLERGTQTAWFNPSCTYYISQYSNAGQPPVYQLNDVKRQLVVRTLEDNAGYPVEKLIPKEFFTFETEDGETLNGFLMKPVDFDSTHRYPVVMMQYSGPGSQQVVDAWGSVDWQQALVPHGIIVACVDGRGTGGRGVAFRSCTYRKLGIQEAQDQIAAARYMAAQPYVDPQRLAIWGWSFGGFTTLMVLSMDTLYKAGVAIAPVTDWRFYDSIYTERYMSTPQENSEGYDAASPLNRAKELSGNLLIVAGTGDDNVHYTNTLRYIDA
ncbi:MAG: S9 family peptidase, partial [Porphyromonadaceae bacterium]|nr:S9 family peptidase [Porphyromonadaceae bacterium]